MQLVVAGTSKLFYQDNNEIAERLKSTGMAVLDLSLPAEFTVVEEFQNPIAQSLGELDVLSAHDRLCELYIDGLDLAGLARKYHFRKAFEGTVLKGAYSGLKIKLVDSAGRVYFDVIPGVFFTINRGPWDVEYDGPTFPQFQRLPIEIRYNIWVLAAEHRCVTALEVCQTIFS